MSKHRRRLEKRPFWPMILVPFEVVIAILARVFGWWYCDRCDRLHGPRVLQFEGRDPLHLVCSLHKRTGANPINER